MYGDALHFLFLCCLTFSQMHAEFSVECGLLLSFFIRHLYLNDYDNPIGNFLAWSMVVGAIR